jgi:hypothetical protein
MQPLSAVQIFDDFSTYGSVCRQAIADSPALQVKPSNFRSLIKFTVGWLGSTIQPAVHPVKAPTTTIPSNRLLTRTVRLHLTVGPDVRVDIWAMHLHAQRGVNTKPDGVLRDAQDRDLNFIADVD